MMGDEIALKRIALIYEWQLLLREARNVCSSRCTVAREMLWRLRADGYFKILEG
jgi:hypothetical protein